MMNSIPSTDIEKACWLALWRAPQIGPIHFNRLLQQLKHHKINGLRTLFTTNSTTWKRLNIPTALQNYLKTPDWVGVQHDLDWSQKPHCHIICLNQPIYPSQLAQIPNPPPILFIKGNLQTLSQPQIAIVGSRRATPPGRELAQQLSTQLSEQGFAITSGLARGIDAAAHQGALSAKGKTLAVLGTGPDRIYPIQHTKLAQSICENTGVLITEFPIGTPCQPKHFPQRNRIISGLSLGTVVVEASLRSGSLITAHFATEQGREVFALPGAVGHPLGQGCNQLIREGAKLTETVTDILEELPRHLTSLTDSSNKCLASHADNNLHIPSPKKLDKKHWELLQCVGFQPTSVDSIAKRSLLSIADVLVILLELELKGYICNTTDGTYLRTRKK